MLIAAAPCQGLLYRERWGYLHLESRRQEVQRELQGRDAATRARVAALLSEPDQGVPFRPVAKALAHLRGVAADDVFVLRTALSTFMLPEVVDPVADNEVCRQANLSIYLPFTVALPKELGFGVEVLDAGGAVVHRGGLSNEVPLADLRMAQATLEIPCAELPDGSYEVRLFTLVDGQMPGPKDPIVRWPLHVRRGYQAHAVAAMHRAKEWADDQGPLLRAMLAGLSRQVGRAFAGEPFDGGSKALAEIDRLTLALDNLEKGEHLLSGMTGDVALAMPGPEGEVEAGLGCVLRLPTPAAFGVGKQLDARPLLVVAAGAPAYDHSGRRPGSPASRMPEWTSRELRDLGPLDGWRVAFVESPGNGRNYIVDLQAAIAGLHELWGTQRPVVLVCEREAAAIVGIQFERLRAQLAGVVMVGGGAMPGPTIDALGDVAVRYVPLHGMVRSRSGPSAPSGRARRSALASGSADRG